MEITGLVGTTVSALAEAGICVLKAPWEIAKILARKGL